MTNLVPKLKVVFTSCMDKHQTKRPRPKTFLTSSIVIADRSIMIVNSRGLLVPIGRTNGITYWLGFEHELEFDHMEIEAVTHDKLT